jgi:molybdopterin synthase sulfur carrier subunit
MTIVVRFFANFRDATGKDRVEVDRAADVASLLNELTKRFGGRLEKMIYHENKKKLREDVNILVNGKPIRLLEGPNTLLKEGDVVAIFPPVAGG